jgi:hypothetical protein
MCVRRELLIKSIWRRRGRCENYRHENWVRGRKMRGDSIQQPRRLKIKTNAHTSMLERVFAPGEPSIWLE